LPQAKKYISDEYEAHEFLDIKKYKVSKFKETNRNGGLYSFLRDILACFMRKIKFYVKSAKALGFYLALIFCLLEFYINIIY